MATDDSAYYTYTIQEDGLYFLAYSAQSRHASPTQTYIDAKISINFSVVANSVVSNGESGANAYAWYVGLLNVGDAVSFISDVGVVGNPYSHFCVVKLK